jgi:uncharacterized protein (TIGR03067 family)
VRLRHSVLLCVTVLVMNGCSSTPPGLTDADIQGSWTPVELNENGTPVAKERLNRIEFIFENGKYNRGEMNATGTAGTAVGMHAVNLDPKQVPTLITLVNLEENNLGKEQQGIIQREGERLKICLGPLDGDRPKEFAPGPKITYAILERKQK